MQKFMYDAKRNTLYINTDLIMCDLNGLTVKEKSIAIRKHFALSIEERIKQSKYKNEILNEIAKYKDCEISEFSTL